MKPPPFGMTLEELLRRHEERTLICCSECKALLRPAVFHGERLEAEPHRSYCSRAEPSEALAWLREEAQAMYEIDMAAAAKAGGR